MDERQVEEERVERKRKREERKEGREESKWRACVE